MSGLHGGKRVGAASRAERIGISWAGGWTVQRGWRPLRDSLAMVAGGGHGWLDKLKALGVVR